MTTRLQNNFQTQLPLHNIATSQYNTMHHGAPTHFGNHVNINFVVNM